MVTQRPWIEVFLLFSRNTSLGHIQCPAGTSGTWGEGALCSCRQGWISHMAFSPRGFILSSEPASVSIVLNSSDHCQCGGGMWTQKLVWITVTCFYSEQPPGLCLWGRPEALGPGSWFPLLGGRRSTSWPFPCFAVALLMLQFVCFVLLYNPPGLLVDFWAGNSSMLSGSEDTGAESTQLGHLLAAPSSQPVKSFVIDNLHLDCCG